jgi:hypothetical protein
VVRDAAWLWVPDAPVDPARIVRFAQARHVREVFVSVPWLGPTDTTPAICTHLRRVGIRVSALGGDIAWARHPEQARAWAERAHAGGLFAATHLDMEPWVATDWPADADVRLAGVAAAVRQVRAVHNTRTLGKHRGLPHLSDRPSRRPLLGNPRASVREAPARNQPTGRSTHSV